MAARKTARKKTAKKAARKKTTRKKATRKKTARKKGGRAKATGRTLVGSELPKSLKALSAQLRRDLNRIERQIETASKQTRRSLTRVVRDASHQLGRLEGRGQKEFRAMSAKARRDVETTVRRVRRAMS